MGRPGNTEERDRALSAAVENHRGPLLAVIRRRIRDQFEAEDVLQEVFEELIQAYDLGQTIEVFGAWLVRVAQNRILDRFRRRKTRDDHRTAALAESPGEELSPDRPDNEWTRAWLRGEIVDALERLPREQREVFVMHELEGKRFEVISAETGVGVNTLLSRKRHAVIFLRNHLKELYDELE